MREIDLKVLITVKAYPQPSRTYGETVCVAGVRVDTPIPEWIRLYPVAYRDLEFANQFKKYQIVSLRAFRSTSDKRPESYKPNIPTLSLGKVIDSRNQWRERWNLLNSLAGATTACQLYAGQDKPNAPSLGLIKPRSITTLEVEPNDGFSDDKRRIAELAAAGDLFTAGRSVLEPAPYRLKYQYLCMEPACGGHTQTLIDWEAGQAARNWLASGYGEEELPDLLRKKFFTEICGPDKDTYFFLGNQHLHPRSFLILGLFWPPAGSRPSEALF